MWLYARIPHKKIFGSMKKIFFTMVLLHSCAWSFAQKKDTLRNIELPASVIREYRQQVFDENSTKRIDKALSKRLNQG